MTTRRRRLLALLLVWLLVLVAAGLLGGVGSVEFTIWLAGTLVLIAAMIPRGKHT